VQHTHHVRCHCRVSFIAKLRFVSWHDTESLFTAKIQQCLRGINADAEVLRSAQRKLDPARYGRVEDVMRASLSSRTQQVMLGDMTQSWSQPWREASCLGQSTRTRLALSHNRAQCVHAATHYIRYNTSSSCGMYLLSYACLGSQVRSEVLQWSTSAGHSVL